MIAGPAGGNGSGVAKINLRRSGRADLRVRVDAGRKIDYKIPEGRYAWVHCAEGNITVNGTAFKEGDGAAVTTRKSLSFAGAGDMGGEFLVFDLA